MIYTDIISLIQSALDGYNVCLFAYGQTGSGKTYTIQGDVFKSGDRDDRGILFRAIDTIIEQVELLENSGWKYDIEVSVLEIYNEQIRDLLVEKDVDQDLEIKKDVKMLIMF